MKTPAILITTVTFLMIGILILDFHLSNSQDNILIPDDFSELIATVQSLDSKILLIGEDLPFPESIQHQVISNIDELSIFNLGQIDYIIVHHSNHLSHHKFSTEQINLLKLYNQQGASIIFVGLSSYDFLEIDEEVLINNPSGIGMIKMNPNAFDQRNYEVHVPQTNNLELRLYNVLRMMVQK
jgi:hypothetical protein